MDTHWTLICLSSIEESQGLPNDEIFVSMIFLLNVESTLITDRSIRMLIKVFHYLRWSQYQRLLKNNTKKKHNKEGLKPQRNHNAFCCQ